MHSLSSSYKSLQIDGCAVSHRLCCLYQKDDVVSDDGVDSDDDSDDWIDNGVAIHIAVP